jgi:hypothetical protein
VAQKWQLACVQKSMPDLHDGFWPISSDGKPLWFPSDPMMHNGARWGDLWRAGTHNGVTRVCHFYTQRNLWALARIWEKIAQAKTDIQFILEFCFTAAVPSCNRMYRYRLSGGGRGSGTLYIPSLSEERNVFKAFSKKASVIAKSLPGHRLDAAICTQSATDLSNMPTDSIDYIFTDPPFGGNLMYSELNFLWEAWLRVFTDQKDEAIINETQGKGLAEYETLMGKSFAEMHRVLKPGRWMTMVFHNSRGDVWQAIQESLNAAGFVIAAIGILDKQQRTFKQATTSGAVGYDVIVNCHKPKAAPTNGIRGKITDGAIIEIVTALLSEAASLPSRDRTARMLYSKTVGSFVQRGVALEDLDFKKFRTLLSKNFKEIDGHWFLSYQRPIFNGQKNLFGFISNESQAIEWLDDFLKQGPKTIGDITPHFFVALGSKQLKKELKQILEENFVEENRRWRNPSYDEQQRLKKLAASATLVEIRQYLAGTLERGITSNILCEWIKFCYDHELFEEGSKLFDHVEEVDVEPSIYVVTKKIAEICRSRL